jgi:Ubiquitin-2 like Rad60 SUMO-like
MSDQEHSTDGAHLEPTPPNQINIKVKDSNSEIYFKIKRTTRFEKVMNAFCDRQGKNLATSRFVFDGDKLDKDDTPEKMNMEDGDMIEVFEQQLGGA